MTNLSLILSCPPDLAGAPELLAAKDAIVVAGKELREAHGLTLETETRVEQPGLNENQPHDFERSDAQGIVQLALQRRRPLAQTGLIRRNQLDRAIQFRCATNIGAFKRDRSIDLLPNSANLQIATFLMGEVLSCVPQPDIATYWRFFDVKPGDPRSCINIVHEAVRRVPNDEKLLTHDWQHLLLPLTVSENVAAAGSIESILGRIRHPAQMIPLNTISSRPSILRQSCVWVCAPRNPIACALLGVVGQRARFTVEREPSDPQAGEVEIHWRQESGSIVRVRSPLSTYLKASGRPEPGAMWQPAFANTFACDFGVLARFSFGRDEHGQPVHHFFLNGIRGLGTWGLGWCVEHRHEIIASALDRARDGDLQILLKVDYSNGTIADVVDVSNESQTFFDKQMDPFRIQQRVRRVPKQVSDDIIDEVKAAELLSISGLNPSASLSSGLSKAFLPFKTDGRNDRATPAYKAPVSLSSGLRESPSIVIDARGPWQVGHPCQLGIHVALDRQSLGELPATQGQAITAIVSAPSFKPARVYRTATISAFDSQLDFRFDLQPCIAGEDVVEVEIFEGPIRRGYAVVMATVDQEDGSQKSRQSINNPELPDVFPINIYETPHIIVN